MSTKLHRAEERESSPQATKSGAEETSSELASALLTGDEDAFGDVPTVGNGANPAALPTEADSGQSQGLSGAGAYRMVRPATSDRIAVPTPAPAERPNGNRVVIGVARK